MKIWIDCRRGSAKIASYPFQVPVSRLPGTRIDPKTLYPQVASQLTTDKLASPPYGDVVFSYRYEG